MRNLIPITALALILAVAPAAAQTTEDPAPTDATGEATEGESTDGEAGGSFSRDIPEGLKATLTEEEISDYQAQLDAAETPQERNAIRQELQRISRERHVQSVQGEKAKPKGLFGNMAADFKDIISGKAARDAKARDRDGKGRSEKNGKDRGGKDRGGKGRGGNDRGGRDSGGGGGGGRSK